MFIKRIYFIYYNENFLQNTYEFDKFNVIYLMQRLNSLMRIFKSLLFVFFSKLIKFYRLM